MYNKVSKFYFNPLTIFGDKNSQKKVHFSVYRVARLRVTRTFILIIRILRIIRKKWRNSKEGEAKEHNITLLIPECIECDIKVVLSVRSQSNEYFFSFASRSI